MSVTGTPAFDLICQAEERRLQLRARYDRLTLAERQDLGNLPTIIAKLWERRRCEMLGASTTPPSTLAADRAGLRSVAITVTHATARRAVLLDGE